MRHSSQGAFDVNVTTLDAISDDLRILLLSNYGERPIHYDFGANLRRVLFEQGPDMKQQIRDSIVSAVDKWMPSLVLNTIDVEDNTTNPSLRSNEVRVKIEFSVGQLQGFLEQNIRG
jgi:phage baseplate assembly protein W